VRETAGQISRQPWVRHPYRNPAWVALPHWLGAARELPPHVNLILASCGQFVWRSSAGGDDDAAHCFDDGPLPTGAASDQLRPVG